MAKSKGRYNTNRSASGSIPEPSSSKRSNNTTLPQDTDHLNSSSSPSNYTSTNKHSYSSSLAQWLYAERLGVSWVLGCALIGWWLGFGIGTGHLTGAANIHSPWRIALGQKIRSAKIYKVLTLASPSRGEKNGSGSTVRGDGLVDSTLIFALLREAIVREKGGYVHSDLGWLQPAPSGAARGLGMVRSSYHACQSTCMPGTSSEKLNHATAQNDNNNNITFYNQEEVLIQVPIEFQITRSVALLTLNPLLPMEVHRDHPLQDLDDAALLVLILAHERCLSRASRWFPYIASLPTEPSCGYSIHHRPFMLDALSAMEEELGLDVNGWKGALVKVERYANTIVSQLTMKYGRYLHSAEHLQWALCHVASRAVAGSEKHGSLRLVPMVDLINHDAEAGAFVELTGKEKIRNGDFVDATEDDSGAFVIRSRRHGRRKPLKRGQELMANYNVPAYSPLDWFISSGFVPPERWHKWQKIDAALPRVRKDAPFAKDTMPLSAQWLKSAGRD